MELKNKRCFCVEIDLMDYREAWDLQSRLAGARTDRILDRDMILMLEHPPVFTLGRRGGLDNLKIPEAFLEARGIQIVHVERGGDITYHAPGQLVVYPIVDLRARAWSVVGFVGKLEEIMIRTAADFGVVAERNTKNRGIWAGQDKLGSVGIAVRHDVSFHGLAINANTDLEPFSWINPCGMKSVQMISMKDLLGRELSMEEVRQSTTTHIEDIFDATLEKVSLEFVYDLLKDHSRKSEKR